jgi:hypothetical protein
MKTSSFFRYAIITGSIIFLASCAKEKIQPADATTGLTPNTASTVVLSLAADHWIGNGDGNFSNTFFNLFQSTNSSSTVISSVRVYVIWGGQEYLVTNNTPLLGGILEATYDDKDLKLTYRSSSNALPFNYLNIKVVIEKK